MRSICVLASADGDEEPQGSGGPTPGIVVDHAASGEPIGLEITAPAHVTVDHINTVFEMLGLATMSPEEFAPLNAAENL